MSHSSFDYNIVAAHGLKDHRGMSTESVTLSRWIFQCTYYLVRATMLMLQYFSDQHSVSLQSRENLSLQSMPEEEVDKVLYNRYRTCNVVYVAK